MWLKGLWFCIRSSSFTRVQSHAHYGYSCCVQNQWRPNTKSTWGQIASNIQTNQQRTRATCSENPHLTRQPRTLARTLPKNNSISNQWGWWAHVESDSVVDDWVELMCTKSIKMYGICCACNWTMWFDAQVTICMPHALALHFGTAAAAADLGLVIDDEHVFLFHCLSVFQPLGEPGLVCSAGSWTQQLS